MLDSLNIQVVVHGDDAVELMPDERDPYIVCRISHTLTPVKLRD
jgi:hypothetical protein